MPGYPCCCSESLGTGIGTGTGVSPTCDCFRVVLAGIEDIAGACPCRECTFIDGTWYTDREFVNWIVPNYDRWSGSICNSASPLEKCGWQYLQNQVTLEGGTYYLNAWLSRTNFIGRPDESGQDYIHWRKDMGASEPDCTTFSGEVLDYYRDSQDDFPNEACDFSSSTATVSTYDTGTGPCPTGTFCNPRGGVCTQQCHDGKVAAHYEIDIPNNWTTNQCECGSKTPTCSAGSGTFLTGENRCSGFWVVVPFPGSIVTLTFSICRTADVFGVVIALRFVSCNFSLEGRDPDVWIVSPAVVWATNDLGPCDPAENETGDCFFGGNPLSVPFIGQTWGGDSFWRCGGAAFSNLLPYEPWMNPCCTYNGAAATVTPVG